MGEAEIYDVLVVGYGPSGQAVTALLGCYGHRVAAFERHPTLYGLPRAGHVDDEIMRTLQSLGCAQRLVDENLLPTGKYYWLNGSGRDLMTMEWQGRAVSGWKAHYMMWQPYLEDALDDVVRAQPTTEVHQGWEAVSLDQHDGIVDLTVQRMTLNDENRRIPTDEFRTVSGRYLIGSDGANGIIREALGVGRDDLGFNESWLDVDAKPRRKLPETAGSVGEKAIKFNADIFQICDPARPRLVCALGRSHRRFEWSLLPGETAEEFERPEKAYELLAEWGVTPEDLEIVRQRVYTFEAKVAQRFRVGNAFLVGDSAHLMPPHMGEGLCSGVRDAKTLAWKLDLVLRGVARDKLLDTYEEERKDNARVWVETSVAVGKVSATLDPVAASERDAAFFSGDPPPLPPPPGLTEGVLKRGDDGQIEPPVGTLSPQGVVRRGEETGLFDDLYGRNVFSIISMAGDPREVLGSAGDLDLLRALPAVTAHIAAEDDFEGTYGQWFSEHQVEAIVVRPDFYIYGVARRLADLPRIVQELGEQVGTSHPTGGTLLPTSK